MGCSASKPGLVNEFRDVKLEQIQKAKLTPPTVGHVVAQPRPEQQKPAQEGQPGFFDANLTFANVVWNNATKAPQALKPALRAGGTSAAAPSLAPAKKVPAKPAAPVPAPKPVATPWAVENDNWDGDDWDEDYDEDEDDDARMADPDMFRTRVNHANFEWEGNGEHIDVLPKKDDKQMVNPFVGVPLPLGRQSLAKQPAAAAYRPSPLEKAAEAIAKDTKMKESKGPSLHASPFEAKQPAAAKPLAAPMASPFAAAGAAAPMASPFASGAKPLQPVSAVSQQAAAMQSLLMNVPPEQQARVRAALLKNQQDQALAQQRAHSAFATQSGAGAMYPSVQHQAQAQQVPNGYTNEMLMQQLQQQQLQARAMQAQQMQVQQMQAQQMQQRQAQAGWQ